MGYYDIIGSRMLLNTLLYAISELSKVNERILFMNKDQNMIIKVTIGDGGPTEFLQIKDDIINFQRDKKFPSYDAEINFNNPTEFFSALKQKKIDLDQLEKEKKIQISGFANFKRNCEEIINIALPYCINELPEENISPQDEALQVKIILFALMAGFQEITEEDENVQEEIRDVNVLIQIQVENGPQCFLRFANGTFKGYMEDIGEKPTVILKLSDLKTARALMTGKGDAAQAFIKGRIQIEGDTKHAMKLMNLNELISDYTDYIKMKQKKL